MDRRLVRIFRLVIASALLSASGCGSGRQGVPTVPVRGTITLDGEPLSDAEVNFLGEKYAGVAMTDSNGKYELRAQPGENVVYVVKLDVDMNDPEFDASMLGTQPDQGGGGPADLLPERYSDPEQSELRYEVPESDVEDANFELTNR